MNPDTQIVVKISKEDAGAISLSRVLQQRVALSDLVAQIVGVTGKDAERITRIVERGTFVKGMSRLRWQGVAASEAVAECLAALPDPYPERAFSLADATALEFHGKRESVVVSLALASKRRWFRRGTFVQDLRELFSIRPPQYERYDYEARSDVYEWRAEAEDAEQFRRWFELLPDASLRRTLRKLPVERLILRLPR